MVYGVITTMFLYSVFHSVDKNYFKYLITLFSYMRITIQAWINPLRILNYIIISLQIYFTETLTKNTDVREMFSRYLHSLKLLAIF